MTTFYVRGWVILYANVLNDTISMAKVTYVMSNKISHYRVSDQIVPMYSSVIAFIPML